MVNADCWSRLVSKDAAKLSAELSFVTVDICRKFAPAATHLFLNLSNTRHVFAWIPDNSGEISPSLVYPF